MLHSTRKTIRATAIAVCLILLVIALRYVRIGTWWGYDVPLACIAPMVYVGLLLYWGITLEIRLTNARVKHLLFASIGLMILWFVLRCAKYDFFYPYSDICRYLWYGYYIPLNFLPILSLMAAWHIGRRGHARALWLLLVPDSIFTALVFSNDLHQWIFRFPSGALSDSFYEQRPLFFVMCAWMAVQYLAALLIIFHQCRISRSRRLVWLPVLWILGIIVFFFWYNAFQFLPIRKPLQVTEAAGIVLTAVWESCIQTGLIPSNIGYQEFFSASTVDAQIEDNGGNVCYSSLGARALTEKERRAAMDTPVFLEPDVRLQSRAIHGGRVYWEDDLSAIHSLSRDLEEARAALAEENDLIREENKIREEQAHLEEHNRLYDSMAEAARPALLKIRILLLNLTPDAEDFSRRLGMACVLCAYVKRSSNLMLLAEREERADAKELALCLRESLDYLSACGVLCSLTEEGEGRIPLDGIRNAYAFFEETIESVLPDLSALVANLSVERETITLRLMLDGPERMPGAEEIDGTFYRSFTAKEKRDDL